MNEIPVNPLINQDLRQEQAKLIKEYIRDNMTGRDRFLVLDNEAGFGKSLYSNAAIALTNKKVIYVKKYLSEANKSEEAILSEIEELKHDYPDLIDLDKKIIVIKASNSSNYEKEAINELKDADVLIISHKKYQILANDDNKRWLYEEGRDILIIDEYLEPEIVTIGENYFEGHKHLFTFDMGDKEYREVRSNFLKIIDTLEINKEKRVGTLRVVDKIEAMKDELPEYFMDNLIESISNLWRIYKANKVSLVNRQLPNLKNGALSYFNYQVFFTELELFLRQQFIYDNYSKIIATNLLFDYWTLSNNIILDASASILHSYELRPELFKRDVQERVFDYRNTTCHIKDLNISKSSIDTMFGDTPRKSRRYYFDAILDHVQSNNCQTDKTLIITDKMFKPLLNQLITNREILGITAIEHHGNVFGKNDWRDFNKIYLTSIFNSPEHAYILQYAFFSGKKITERDLGTRVENHTRRFVNHDITSIQYSWRVHHLYQELKRVNRELNRETDFYLISADDWIVESIKIAFKNIKVKNDYNINFNESSKQKRNRRLSNSKISDYERYKDIFLDMFNNPDINTKGYFACKAEVDSKRLKQILTRAKNDYPNLIKNEIYDIDLDRTFENKAVKRIVFRE